MIESLRRRASRFGLDIILIDVWEGSDARAEATLYCQMWGIEATVLLDGTASYARRLGIRGVPTNVFVDEHGIVRHVGATTPEEFLAQARRLVPELEGLPDPVELAPVLEGEHAPAARRRLAD